MPFIDINQIKEIETFPGFKGRFFHSESMTIAHWNIEAGSAAPVHTHIHEQTVSVIYGQLEFTINGEVKILGPGEGAVIPSMVPHGAKAVSDCYIVDTFSPVREDYKTL
ncbi:MAG TPA: cupin domain-containing protein [Cyclobacteriaceae bacterium]